jgi:enoyl-CoA hydratase/carnithine racemase
VRIGLADQLVPQPEVRSKAIELAEEIAASSPVAVQSTRSTLRAGLVEQFRLAVARESIEQNIHFETEDFQEGVRAMSERRMPRFKGH